MRLDQVYSPRKISILETPYMHDIISDVTKRIEIAPPDEQMVAIIDLDFTLVMANTPQGHPKYFRSLVKFLQENRHMSEEDARSRVLLEIFGTASPLTTIARDGHDEGPDARSLLAFFHAHAIPVFAVTARSTILSTQTINALDSLGFTFSRPTHIHSLELCKKDNPSLDDNARFINGILFCGKNKKGILTKHLLHYLKIHPTTIFAVDDDRDNLETISHAMQTLPATTIGYRYGFLDQESRDFSFTPKIIPPWALEIPSTIQSVDTLSQLASPISPGPSSCPSTKTDNTTDQHQPD